MRRESVARWGSRLTLVDPVSGWAAHRVALLTGSVHRWRGVKAGMDRVLMRVSFVHGRGLEHAVVVVGIDSQGRVVCVGRLLPGRFERLPGATWTLELPDGHPCPAPGALVALYAR